MNDLLPKTWFIGALLGLCCALGCQDAPERAVTTAPLPPAPQTPAPGQAPTEFSFADKDSVLKMAAALREVAGTEELQGWLEKHAQYPFDVDGALRATSIESLMAALRTEHPELSKELAPHTTCEAITRAELLDGQPWHFIDRLGGRPPKDELARDLDRLGLKGKDWWINCYTGQEAGFFLIVTNKDGAARLIALRK